jgi:hypothetical protein
VLRRCDPHRASDQVQNKNYPHTKL